MCNDGLFGNAFDFDGNGEIDSIESAAEYAYLSDDYDDDDEGGSGYSDDDDGDDW